MRSFEDLPEDVKDELLMLDVPGVEPEERLPVLREVVGRFPDFVPARLNLAASLLDSGDAAEAEKTYREVLEEYPGEMGAVAGLATVLAERGDLGQAELLAEQALASGYVWSPCYAVIAQARLARGDRSGAAEAQLVGYECSPHSWNHLRDYCELTGRRFEPPTGTVTFSLNHDQLRELIGFIDAADEGCDNTLRYSKQWAAENGVDFIDLYQFLNANGGFCDCEVGLNVSDLLLE
jgi:tetratricopeptide (TPR) repeat protein